MAQQSLKCHQIEKMEQKNTGMFWGKFDILFVKPSPCQSK